MLLRWQVRGRAVREQAASLASFRGAFLAFSPARSLCLALESPLCFVAD